MFKSKLLKDIEKAEKQIENGEYRTFTSVEEMFNSFGPTPWWKEYIYYPIYRFFDNGISPMTWWYRLKRFAVFLTKGFDPKDTWSLDTALAKWILPRLKYLKDNKQGCPFIDGFEEVYKNNDASEEEWEQIYNAWDEIMSKMILAFELTLTDSSEEEDEEKIKEGMKLFARYYRNLWD